jgi:cytosine/uracil/thiamine/allantoin permease
MSEIAERPEAAEAHVLTLPKGASSSLYNADLAPATKREWGVYSLFCMWMSDVSAWWSPTSPPCC